ISGTTSPVLAAATKRFVEVRPTLLAEHTKAYPSGDQSTSETYRIESSILIIPFVSILPKKEWGLSHTRTRSPPGDHSKRASDEKEDVFVNCFNIDPEVSTMNKS